jgi:hypothetical protein
VFAAGGAVVLGGVLPSAQAQSPSLRVSPQLRPAGGQRVAAASQQADYIVAVVNSEPINSELRHQADSPNSKWQQAPMPAREMIRLVLSA